MNLRDLQYVIAVAQHKNFTRAAEAVSVSQPALSNQIKKLELNLGLAIFQRDPGGVSLTAFGRDVLSNAQQIMDLVDGIGDLTRKHLASDTQPLRLGMTPTLAAYLSRYFRDMFLKITCTRGIVVVEEYPVALAKMVAERTIDMAFIARKSFNTIFDSSKTSMNFTSLWLEPLFLATRVGHPLAANESIWAHQVPAAQLIRFDVSFGYDLEHDLPPSSDAVAESTGIDVKNARFETVCRHVAQSDTCTIVNAIAAEQFKRDGFGLAFIPFEDVGNIRELGVLTRPQYPHPEIITALQDGISQDAPPGTVASCKNDMSATTN